MSAVPSSQNETAPPDQSMWLKLLWLRLRRSDWMMLGLVVTLFGMIAFFSSMSPYFLSVRNFLNIGRAVAIPGIVAVGFTIVMIAGGLDLSVTAVMAAVSMLVVSLIKGGGSEWLAAVLGCAFGGLLGATNGLIITKARINPLVCTLGTMSIIRGLAYVISEGQNVSIGMQRFAFMARGQIAGIPTALIWWLAACALGFFILRYTLFGQYIYAIGGSALACRVSGVKVNVWRFLTYVICGVFAGFAGVLLVSQAAVGSPAAMVGAELEIVAAVILGGVGMAGGRGGIAGTMLGTVILGVFNNGMIMVGVPPEAQYILRGVIMLVAVMLDSIRSGGGYR